MLDPDSSNKLHGSTETVTCIPLSAVTLFSSMLPCLVKPLTSLFRDTCRTDQNSNTRQTHVDHALHISVFLTRHSRIRDELRRGTRESAAMEIEYGDSALDPQTG